MFNARQCTCLGKSYRALKKFVWGGGVVCLIIVSTPGPSFTKTCLDKSYRALKKFVWVGWWGGEMVCLITMSTPDPVLTRKGF